MDVAMLLHAGWLLPVLAVLVAADGPFPMLPSEPLVLSAAAVAFGRHDAVFVAGIFLAALLGSLAGDAVTFGIGRGTRRIAGESAVTRWVHANVVRRTGVTLVGARFLPAGRLVSTAAAGRYGVPLRRFLPWSALSSVAWSGYILTVGFLLGPVTHGDPLLSLAAGLAMAALTAGTYAAVVRVRRVARA